MTTRYKMLTMQVAQQRYLFFLDQHPELQKRVPLKYIASYLALTPETLSRIKSELQAQPSH